MKIRKKNYEQILISERKKLIIVFPLTGMIVYHTRYYIHLHIK